VGFVVLASGLALGQATAQNSGSANTNSVSDELKALREAISQQQQQISQQQQQIQTLQQQLEKKDGTAQQTQDASSSASDPAPAHESTPHVVNASLNTTPVSATMVQEVEKKESPLSFRIGGMDFTPGGFADFQNIFRTGNTGSVVSTNFAVIPFSNTAAGHLSEYRATGQYSRWNMKIGGKYGLNNITGYIEGDFNGNDAANVFATTNPHTLRLRLYFADFRRGMWEFTAGQSWSLITPNRVGTSPMTSDLATSYSADGNILVGMPYSRDGQFRVTVHPNDHFSWAVSINNAQQFTVGEVVAPATFATVLANGGSGQSQLDGNATPGTPNLFPDFMTKMAFDTNTHGRNFHVEFGGLTTSAKVAVQPAGFTTFQTHSSIGAGGMGGFNFELFKNFRVLAYGVYGNGVGRYFNALGPQFVVSPVNITATTFDVATSMIHAGDAYTGIETQLGKKTQIGAYYGGVYYQRNTFADLTAPNTTGAPISCGPGQPLLNKPCIGFGGTNSANTNNRSIQEGDFVITQTLWKNPQFGALLLINDASYSSRAPWFVAVNQPKNAHMFMDHLVLRYVIP
jgi:uncharacterized coiled-coil protein SlyX